jgi:hypothetical protein
MTIADMPDHILGRLERKAAKARRSLEQELIHLLERALSRDRPDDSGSIGGQVPHAVVSKV